MPIIIDEITAKVHHETSKGVLIVKVGFPKIGMWQNGWTVRKSPSYPEKGLWVQPPATKVGARWMKVIEFDTKGELHGLIVDEIHRAVDFWNAEKVITQSIDELSGDELEIAKNVFPDEKPP